MSAEAQIRWMTPEEGGRSAPPSGLRYSTVAKFEHQSEEQWFKDAWSLVLDISGPLGEDRVQTVSLSFLAEDAPEEWLATGKRFGLYEGRKKVAEGVVGPKIDSPSLH